MRRLRSILFYTFIVLLLGALALFVVGMRMSFRESEEDLKAYFAEKSQSLELAYFKSGKDSIRYALTGNADSPWIILFIHGAPGGLGMFKQYLAEDKLNSRALIMGVDRLGYGYSQYGQSEVSIPRQAQILADLMKEFPDKKFILYAHSFGGPIAGHLAYLMPQQVATAVLAGAAVDPEQERFVALAKFANSPLIKWIGVADTWVASDEKIAHPDQLRSIEKIWSDMEVPLVVQHGTADWLVPYENVAYLEARVPQALLDVHTMEDESHFFFGKMDVVGGILIACLDKLEKTSSEN